MSKYKELDDWEIMNVNFKGFYKHLDSDGEILMKGYSFNDEGFTVEFVPGEKMFYYYRHDKGHYIEPYSKITREELKLELKKRNSKLWKVMYE